MVDPVGSVLSGRYQLARRLGEGGMGAVYEAVDCVDGTKCAVKVLHPEHSMDGQIVERLYAEVQAASRLSHPNIARYFAFAQTPDGISYLVMELLVGVPLSRYLGEGRTYEPSQVLPILRGVLNGLAAAHSHGIVHRDLKPENIYLARAGMGPPIPKLLDFGIAKIIDAAGGMMSKTKTGALLGTPGYMSPEQIRSAKDVDARSDLWSAGVVLYQLLSGIEPFQAPTDMGKLAAVINQEPIPIDQVRPQLAPWGEFFARALAKNPQQRFSSAEEMSHTMEAAALPRQRTSVESYLVHPTRPSGRFSIPSLPPTQGFDNDVAPAAASPTPAGPVPALQQTLPSANGNFVVGTSAMPIGPRHSGPSYTPATPIPVFGTSPPGSVGYASRTQAVSYPSGQVPRVTLPTLPEETAASGIPVWVAGLGVAVAFLVGLAMGLLLGPR